MNMKAVSEAVSGSWTGCVQQQWGRRPDTYFQVRALKADPAVQTNGQVASVNEGDQYRPWTIRPTSFLAVILGAVALLCSLWGLFASI